MQENQIRRLVILNRDKRLVGIVALMVIPFELIVDGENTLFEVGAAMVSRRGSRDNHSVRSSTTGRLSRIRRPWTARIMHRG